MRMKVYRICEIKKNELYTLFHGIAGSRKMKMNTWLTASIKPVRDGSREKAKLYQSGFHTIPTLEECRKFLNRFSAPRELAIVECEIGNNHWPKKHSLVNIILAEKIKLIKIIEKYEI